MEKYTHLRMPSNDGFGHTGVAKNLIMDENNRLIYAEVLAFNHNFNKSLNYLTRELKSKNGYRAMIKNSEELIERNPVGKYMSKSEDLNRGQGVSYIWDESVIKGKDTCVFIGRNEDDIYHQFKNWLATTQPLPYPHGYKEDLDAEAEKYLFDLMVERELIKTLHNEHDTVLAYKVSTYAVNGEAPMQQAILQVVKDASLLEIDRVRKRLRNAPGIGESNISSAEVLVSFKNRSSGDIYHIVEAVKGKDDAFALVENNGEIRWEEINVEVLFNNESTVVLKSEDYKGLYINAAGEIEKKEK